MSGLIGFFKGQTAEHILRYRGGNIVGEGPGIAFYYVPMNTNIVAVPTSSLDAGFVFNEVTNNFQAVAVQGQFTYRINNPRQTATLLNFAIDPRTHKYLSSDPDKLQQRIANIIQMQTRGEIQVRSLEETLQQSEGIAASVLERIRAGQLLDVMGVELLNLFIIAAKPTPEVAKALEATYRESLLRRADEATYARRAAGVEEERKIKENELSTQITLEKQRQGLISLAGSNAEREAEFRGKALEQEHAYRLRIREAELKLYQSVDPRTLLGMAIKALGDNAQKVGNLTLTTEVLSSLLNGVHTSPGSADHGTD